MQVSANFINTTALTIPKDSCRQQRLTQSSDCYKQNAASAEVIDAEFIDTSSPATKSSFQANNNSILFFVPESTASENADSLKNIKNRFQQAPLNTPPPGTYVNVYA